MTQQHTWLHDDLARSRAALRCRLCGVFLPYETMHAWVRPCHGSDLTRMPVSDCRPIDHDPKVWKTDPMPTTETTAAPPRIDPDAPNVPLTAGELEAIALNVQATPERVKDLVAANAALTAQLEQTEARLARHRKMAGRLRRYIDSGVDCYPSDLEDIMLELSPGDA